VDFRAWFAERKSRKLPLRTLGLPAEEKDNDDTSEISLDSIRGKSPVSVLPERDYDLFDSELRKALQREHAKLKSPKEHFSSAIRLALYLNHRPILRNSLVAAGMLLFLIIICYSLLVLTESSISIKLSTRSGSILAIAFPSGTAQPEPAQAIPVTQPVSAVAKDTSIIVPKRDTVQAPRPVVAVAPKSVVPPPTVRPATSAPVTSSIRPVYSRPRDTTAFYPNPAAAMPPATSGSYGLLSSQPSQQNSGQSSPSSQINSGPSTSKPANFNPIPATQPPPSKPKPIMPVESGSPNPKPAAKSSQSQIDFGSAMGDTVP
jgi:hypothetical protein